jgi:hypothetical protein
VALAQRQHAQVPPVPVAVSNLFTNSEAAIAMYDIPIVLAPVSISPPGLQSILRI